MLHLILGAGLPPSATHSTAKSSPADPLITSLPLELSPVFLRNTSVGGTETMYYLRIMLLRTEEEEEGMFSYKYSSDNQPYAWIIKLKCF